MFGSIGMPELIIILVIALIIFGPRKLPELGKSLGRSLNEFKKASTDLQNTLEQEIKIEEQKEAVTKAKQEEKTDEAPKLKINFNVGDRVKINEGTFDNFEGEVDSIDEASGRVTVMINIFGRSTPVELEYWQIENI